MLPGVITGNWQDNEVMTAVESLQHKGRDGPNPQYGQYSYLTPHHCHDWLGTIKAHNNLFVEPRPVHINITSEGGNWFFFHTTLFLCVALEKHLF